MVLPRLFVANRAADKFATALERETLLIAFIFMDADCRPGASLTHEIHLPQVTQWADKPGSIIQTALFVPASSKVLCRRPTESVRLTILRLVLREASIQQ